MASFNQTSIINYEDALSMQNSTSDSTVMRFSSKYDLADIKTRISKLNPNNYPSLFIFVIEVASISKIQPKDKDEIHEILNLFDSESLLFLFFQEEIGNACIVYHKAPDSNVFNEIDLSARFESFGKINDYISCFAQRRIEEYKDNIVKSVVAVQDSSVILKFLNALNLTKELFYSLLVKCAAKGSKNDIQALLNVNGFFNNSSLEKLFIDPTDFNKIILRSLHNEIKLSSVTSILQIAIENSNEKIVEYLLTHYKHLIKQLPFVHQIQISTKVFNKGDIGTLIRLVNTIDFPFPNDYDGHTVTDKELQKLAFDRTEFHKAIFENDSEKLRTFVERNSNLKLIFNTKNQSALSTAILTGNYELYAQLKSWGMILEHEDIIKRLTKEEKDKLDSAIWNQIISNVDEDIRTPFDYHEAPIDDSKKFCPDEQVRNFNKVAGLENLIGAEKLELANDKNIGELLEKDSVVLSSKIPKLLLITIYKHIQKENLLSTNSIFVSLSLLLNKNICRMFQEILAFIDIKIFIIWNPLSSKGLENVVNFIVRGDLSKYVFIVSDEHLPDLQVLLKNENVIQNDVKFSFLDLSVETQSKLMQTKVNFQNNLPTKLNSLIRFRYVNGKFDDEPLKIFDENLLKMLIDETEIAINCSSNCYEQSFDLDKASTIIANDTIHDQIRDVGAILVSDSSSDVNTLMLNNISKVIREKNPSKWITYVDLSKHTFASKDINSNQDFSKFIIENILKLTSKFEGEVFDYLYNNGKVCIIFDQVEKLSPDCIDKFISLCKLFVFRKGNQLFFGVSNNFDTLLKRSLQIDLEFRLDELRKDVHSYGKPEYIVKLSSTDATCKENRIFVKPLQKILNHEDVKDAKIVVFSTIGEFRKGKSYFLNYCLKYLYGNYKSINYPDNPTFNSDNWIGEKDEPLLGFSWRAGVDRDTKGVVIWNDAFLHTNADTGEKVAILIVDTEGLQNGENNLTNESKLVAFSTLISSIQILNSTSSVQDEISSICPAVEIAKSMVNYTMKTTKPFQILTILIRDFEYNEEDNQNLDIGKRFLDSKLQYENKILLTNFFDLLRCSVLPHPGEKVTGAKRTSRIYDGNWGDMDDDFEAELKTLIEELFKPENLIVKKINELHQTGSQYLKYVENFLQIFLLNDFPSIQDPYEATVFIELTKLVDSYFEEYKKNLKIDKRCSKDKSHLESLHKKIKLDVTRKFDNESCSKIGTCNEKTTHKKNLETKIDSYYETLTHGMK